MVNYYNSFSLSPTHSSDRMTIRTPPRPSRPSRPPRLVAYESDSNSDSDPEPYNMYSDRSTDSLFPDISVRSDRLNRLNRSVRSNRSNRSLNSSRTNNSYVFLSPDDSLNDSSFEMVNHMNNNDLYDIINNTPLDELAALVDQMVFDIHNNPEYNTEEMWNAVVIFRRALNNAGYYN